LPGLIIFSLLAVPIWSTKTDPTFFGVRRHDATLREKAKHDFPGYPQRASAQA